MTRRRRAAGLLAIPAAAAAVLLVAPAQAAGEGFDHTEMLPGGSLQITATVPGEGALDLSGARVSVDGERVEAAAQEARFSSVLRTVVVLVDTRAGTSSEDLTGVRSALLDNLDDLPSDVRMGLVAVGEQARVISTPGTDHSSLALDMGDLATAGDGDLADGLDAAVAQAGTVGFRRVLLLAPGGASGALGDAISTTEAAGVDVETVALDQPREVEAAIAAQAQGLARQVVVTAAIPPGTDARDAEISLAIGTGSERRELKDRLDVVSPSTTTAASVLGIPVSPLLVYAGIAVAAVGFLAALASLVLKPRKHAGDVLSEQVGLYGRDGQSAGRPIDLPAPTSLTGHAQDLAARALANNEGLQAKVAARLEGADIDMRPAEWLPLHAVIGIITGAVGLLLTSGNIIGLLVGVLLGLLVPWVVLGIKRSRRLRAFQSQLAETLQLMAGSLQAGLSLAQSIDTIVREGAEPMVTEFRRAVVEARLGVDLEDALDDIAERMDSKDFKWVVMAIRIQRSVGGNLAELLLKVAGTLREREYIRRHVRALSAEGRLSVYVLGGLPPLFLVYLTLTNWDYVGVLFTTTIGWVMLGTMCMLLVAGVFWMSKVAKVNL